MPTKLLLADDHQLFRESLANMFDKETIEVIGHAGNGHEAIEQARKLKPDIILMDISMNGMSGIEATTILRKELPATRIIGLSMHSDKRYIRGMLEAGASGYLLKSCSHGQLLNAINAVISGNKFLSDEITDIVISDYLSDDEESEKPHPKLTLREIEVLKLYAEGKTTKQIADKLFLSSKTVGTHKQNIQTKTNLKSTVDMVRYAIKRGWIKL